jgi:Uma2 family endonuclease
VRAQKDRTLGAARDPGEQVAALRPGLGGGAVLLDVQADRRQLLRDHVGTRALGPERARNRAQSRERVVQAAALDVGGGTHGISVIYGGREPRPRGLMKACPTLELRSTMTAMPVAQIMTADEFIRLPVPDHGRPWNLVDGEVVVNEPTRLHMATLLDLALAFRQWTDAGDGRGTVCLPIDVKLDERNVYAPDLLWYSEDRAPALHDQRPYPMPGIVVEVRSPSTWRYDVGVKALAYERAGLAELWLVDTVAREIVVYRRSSPTVATFDVALQIGEGERLTSPQLPGFALDVASLFAG